MAKMDEMEFDKTRKAIRADALQSDARKEMMDKLSSAGGKVLNEKSVQKPDPEKGSGGSGGKGGGGRGVDVKLPSEIAREQRRLEMERLGNQKRARESEEREATSFVARFLIKLKCRLAGITFFGQDMVTPRFMSQLNLDAKRALMEAHILGNDLFMSNPEVARNIIKELDRVNPLYVESIERATALYDRNELSDMTSGYNSNPDIPVVLGTIRIPLFSILRKLYYLKAYQNTYLQAVDLAIDIQQKLEKKQTALYASKRKKIRADWNNLMNGIYPALVLLAQRAEMKKAEPGSFLFEEMINVQQEEKLGKRKVGEGLGPIAEQVKVEKTDTESTDEETPEEDQVEEVVEEEEELPAGSPRAIGMGIMNSISIAEIRKKFDTRNEYGKLKDVDKVLISFMLFRYFEYEYSLLLTTPKIQLNSVYRNGKKVDLRRSMSDLLGNSRTVYERMRNYMHEVEEFEKHVSESNMSSNYVEHQKRLSILDARRASSGREVRVQIQDLMRKINNAFEFLLKDMKEGTNVVGNKDDIMKFDAQLEAGRKLEGKTVYDCISEAGAFTTTMHDRLEGGDLFGGHVEMTPEEFQKSFPGSAGSETGTPGGGTEYAGEDSFE